MKLSVIIPCLNEEQTIPILLQQLTAQTRIPDEIIVVDGGSVDNTAKEVRKFDQVTLVHSEPPVGNQRHQGALQAQGDWLVFLDADSQVDHNFMSQLEKEIHKNKFDLACPRYIPMTKSLYLKGLYLLFNSLFRLFKVIAPSGGGMAIICSQKAYHQTKGFNKDYVFDDIEFIRRAGRMVRFSLLQLPVLVSVRRFEKYGYLSVSLHYLLLSVFFTLGLFKIAEILPYPFMTAKNN